jgi:hypothetical protein
MFAPPPPEALPLHDNPGNKKWIKILLEAAEKKLAANKAALAVVNSKNTTNTTADSQFKSDALITGALTSVGGAIKTFIPYETVASALAGISGFAYNNPITIGLGVGVAKLITTIYDKYNQQKVSTNVTPTENELKIATEIKTREKLAHHAQELIQRGKHDEVLSDDIIQAFNNVMEMYKNSSKIIFQHESIIPEVIVFIGNEYNYSQKRKEKLEAQNETDFSINEKLEAYISSQVAQLASAYEAMPEAQRLKINQSNWKNGIIENFFSLATQGFYLYNIYGALTSGSLGYAGQTLLGLTHSAYRGFGVDYSTNNGRQPPLLAANRRINDAHPKPHNDAKHRDAVNHYLRYANHRA